MKCDNCKNKEICKHVDYMQTIEDKIKDLDLDKNVTIGVEIKCYHIQDKNIGCIRSDFNGYPRTILFK